MSYMALYRKWRPDAFEEIKGQEHIVTTIRNQIVHDRVGHAYLFCVIAYFCLERTLYLLSVFKHVLDGTKL